MLSPPFHSLSLYTHSNTNPSLSPISLSSLSLSLHQTTSLPTLSLSHSSHTFTPHSFPLIPVFPFSSHTPTPYSSHSHLPLTTLSSSLSLLLILIPHSLPFSLLSLTLLSHPHSHPLFTHPSNSPNLSNDSNSSLFTNSPFCHPILSSHSALLSSHFLNLFSHPTLPSHSHYYWNQRVNETKRVIVGERERERKVRKNASLTHFFIPLSPTPPLLPKLTTSFKDNIKPENFINMNSNVFICTFIIR